MSVLSPKSLETWWQQERQLNKSRQRKRAKRRKSSNTKSGRNVDSLLSVRESSRRDRNCLTSMKILSTSTRNKLRRKKKRELVRKRKEKGWKMVRIQLLIHMETLMETRMAILTAILMEALM